MVAGASEVRLPDRGGNPAAVARGDCLRMAVDVLPSGKLGREFLAGYAGGKELPFLAGADRCRRSGMRPVAVLRNGISKRKAVLPSCEAESDAGEVRDNGRIPETARSMPVPTVCYRQFCIVLHYSRTKEPFQGATTDRKVAGDTGR